MKLSIILAALILGSANLTQSGNAKADKIQGLDVLRLFGTFRELHLLITYRV